MKVGKKSEISFDLHFYMMKHLLITRFSAMGDVAMTVPVIRALIAQHPDVRVTVASRPFFKPFFDSIPHVDFFPIDVNDKHKGITGLYRLSNELKALNIDTFADFHNVLRTKILGFFLKLKGVKTATTDKGRTEKKALVKWEHKTITPVKSMHERHIDTLKKLGLTVDLSKVSFPKKTTLSQNLIKITGNKTQQWIGIAPFAQYETKMYPQDLMQKVVQNLGNNPDYQVFLFGGKNEIEELNKLKNNNSKIKIITGNLNFEEELQLISHLDVMLSMDSGNGHIAAMYGVPVVTLWGQTHPFAGFVPFNQPLSNSITPDLTKYPYLPTSIYGNKSAPNYEDCMRDILPEKVVQKINEVLNT